MKEVIYFIVIRVHEGSNVMQQEIIIELNPESMIIFALNYEKIFLR